MNGVRLNLHSDRFQDRRTKRMRDRSTRERRAIEEEADEEYGFAEITCDDESDE